MKTGLCVIFNHPFREQIPMLRSFYQSRFDKILFIHPFDRAAAAEDVHISNGGGFSFDVMLAGARDRVLSYFRNYDAVLFAHNDLLLNPNIYGSSFAQEYGMDYGTILAPEMGNLSGTLDTWLWAYRAAMNWKYTNFLFGGGAFFAKNFLPSADAAKARMRLLGLNDQTTIAPATAKYLASALPVERYIHDVLFGFTPEPFDLGYPLINGYSDFFCIPTTLLPEWFDALGPLSSLSLFPEVSIPTATALTAKRLITPMSTGHVSHALWGASRVASDDMEWIKAKFDNGDTFIHPVKYNQIPEAQRSELASLYAAHPRGERSAFDVVYRHAAHSEIPSERVPAEYLASHVRG